MGAKQFRCYSWIFSFVLYQNASLRKGSKEPLARIYFIFLKKEKYYSYFNTSKNFSWRNCAMIVNLSQLSGINTFKWKHKISAHFHVNIWINRCLTTHSGWEFWKLNKTCAILGYLVKQNSEKNRWFSRWCLTYRLWIIRLDCIYNSQMWYFLLVWYWVICLVSSFYMEFEKGILTLAMLPDINNPYQHLTKYMARRKADYRLFTKIILELWNTRRLRLAMKKMFLLYPLLSHMNSD